MLKIEDFIINNEHESKVNYRLYKNNPRKTALPKKKLKNSIFKKNQACFSSLKLLVESKDVNTIISNFSYKQIGKKKATQWIKIAKKEGFLPKYINITQTIEKQKLSFSLKRHTNNEWYVFLSIVRFLHSEPNTVLNAIVMIDKGVDFFTALICGAKFNFDNSNHHFVPSDWCSGYMADSKILVEKKYIPFKQVVALKQFIANMSTMKIKHKHFTGFTCNKHMENIYNNIKCKETFKIKDVDSKKYKSKLASL